MQIYEGMTIEDLEAASADQYLTIKEYDEPTWKMSQILVDEKTLTDVRKDKSRVTGQSIALARDI